LTSKAATRCTRCSQWLQSSCSSRTAMRTAGTRMLTYADVCWRMLTYADVCWRMLTAMRTAGTQCACFTSTKVQTLTPEELRLQLEVPSLLALLGQKYKYWHLSCCKAPPPHFFFPPCTINKMLLGTSGSASFLSLALLFFYFFCLKK
jgi:hypothetical protein